MQIQIVFFMISHKIYLKSVTVITGELKNKNIHLKGMPNTEGN